jgi:lipoprotein-releasing system permease protein
MAHLAQMIGWRYLRAKRREGFIALTSWFAIVGITLGVATLILVMSLMNGIREEMRNQFLGVGGHIGIATEYRAFTDYASVIAQLSDIPQIESASAKIEGQVMATSRGRALGAQVIALSGEDLKKRARLYHAIQEGAEKSQNGLILGERLARNLGVTVGDTITLISPQGRATIAGFVPRMKTYPIIGTLKLGMHAYDSSLILMPFADAQVFFQLNTPQGGAVSSVEIMLKDTETTESTASIIQARLGDAAQVWNWQESNRTVFAALTVQRNVMVVILTLIILVAVFNIISTQMMLVKEKGRDIAILRTMGASRGLIRRIFMLSGLSIGAIGTSLGLGLGLLLASNIDNLRHAIEAATGQELLPQNIYFLSTLPTRTNPSEVVYVVVVALGLSLLATLYPASRAAALDPVEGLRYE